ncbi:MAG: YkgJ family cysteine cluster protein [Thermoguttaceae bacterium]
MRIPFRFETVAAVGPPSSQTAERIAVAGLKLGGIKVGRRLCGDCQACCIHLPISAGEACDQAKPAGMACPHLAPGGCRIYQDRPATCRRFQCVWLSERTWPLEWRPDRSGLLCLREKIDDDIFAAVAYEIEADAITQGTATAILTRLTETTAVVALVNLQQQRRLVSGIQRAETAATGVRRPHFLCPIRDLEGLRRRPLPEDSRSQ